MIIALFSDIHANFDYDIERSATAIEASPLPDEFADRLRKAY